MEKNQYKLCIEILRIFHREGLLDHFILIGSWAVVFYEDYFRKNHALKGFVLRTRDVAVHILKALIANNESGLIRKAFNSVPASWQKKIIDGLKLTDEQELLNIVRNGIL